MGPHPVEDDVRVELGGLARSFNGRSIRRESPFTCREGASPGFQEIKTIVVALTNFVPVGVPGGGGGQPQPSLARTW